MAINFSNLTLEVIDITINATPDIFINQNGITFSKRVLEDLGYPQNVQFSFDAAQHVFVVRPCKGNELKATAFSKPKGEQTATLSCGNKTVHDVVAALIPEYDPKKRYKVTGFFDAENRIMYYDMSEAEESAYRSTQK